MRLIVLALAACLLAGCASPFASGVDPRGGMRLSLEAPIGAPIFDVTVNPVQPVRAAAGFVTGVVTAPADAAAASGMRAPSFPAAAAPAAAPCAPAAAVDPCTAAPISSVPTSRFIDVPDMGICPSCPPVSGSQSDVDAIINDTPPALLPHKDSPPR